MEITFVDHVTPALEAGEYLVSLDQTLLNKQPTGPSDTISETHLAARRLVVRGERLQLDPAAVHAVFPPANSQASYDAVLPHVVLTSGTLPWERSVNGGEASGPWLALLLFDAHDAHDAPPPLETVQAGDLQRQPFARKPGASTLDASSLPAKAVSYPDFAPRYGESLHDRCQVIDVPVDLFAKVAPSLKDLGWLAHARSLPNGELYPVLVGNRLAASGSTSTVHLVSLEGMAAYLPAGLPYKAAQISLPDGSPAAQIRLISLHSWSFTAADQPESFEDALTHLNVGPMERTAKQETMAQTFGLGYTAIDHATRRGGSTVSWYRGPLLPAAACNGGAPNRPADRSDELLRYDPTTGMFDVSYAAAWELGRLLAIQSKTFSSSLHKWRRALNRAAAGAALRTGGAPIDSARALLRDRERLAAVHDDEPPPDAVVEWLVRLRRMEGVPFSYLVADEGLLPPNSIRFFCLDQRWVEALVDGALSVGRALRADAAHDALAAPRLSDLSRAAASQQAPVSGFLLRSAVVVGWPGLGIEVSDDKGAPLPVHQVQLGSSILLLMADGLIARAAFHEPPQALHFGVDDIGNGKYAKRSRYVTVPSGAPPGTRAGMPAPRAPVRVYVWDGRVGIDDLASLLRLGLMTAHGNNDDSGNPRPFGAAEFALQMVEGAQSVAFVNVPAAPSS